MRASRRVLLGATSPISQPPGSSPASAGRGVSTYTGLIGDSCPDGRGGSCPSPGTANSRGPRPLYRISLQRVSQQTGRKKNQIRKTKVGRASARDSQNQDWRTGFPASSTGLRACEAGREIGSGSLIGDRDQTSPAAGCRQHYLRQRNRSHRLTDCVRHHLSARYLCSPYTHPFRGTEKTRAGARQDWQSGASAPPFHKTENVGLCEIAFEGTRESGKMVE